MSLSMKQACPDGGIGSEKIYITSNLDKYMSKDANSSLIPFLNRAETASESPLIRQETYYEDSTIRDKSSVSAGLLENLDTIEDEEFDIEEINDKGFNYAPKTLLEAVDTMLIILEDLGNRYSKWKYENNGIYRFYCHKYNLTNIDASRPYYSKILNQLNNIDSISLHLLSTHYKAKSDSAVYTSNDLVDNILCQLDELVSCYCSKKCAFGISNEVFHVCSDISAHHTNLKWKYPTTAERFLALSKATTSERSVLSEKIKSMERNPSLEWSRPLSRSLSLDQNILHRPISTESVAEADAHSERPKLEGVLEKLENGANDLNHDLGESCFIREMGDYNKCVMLYFSERGIMHNFSQPYVKGEEAVPVHPFLRAVICYNCGKFCRCRCQRKIFRNDASEADFYPHIDDNLDIFERRSKEFINEIYLDFRGKSRLNELSFLLKNKENVTICQKDLRSIHLHTVKSACGRIQFLTSTIESMSPSNRESDEQGIEDTKKRPGLINTNITKGSKIDASMGSVYYSNLFRGNVAKVSAKEIFEIINSVPFSCVPAELFNAYKKAEWYEMYSSVWWRLDTRFEEAQLLEDEGSLEPYILNALHALGYLGNIRYDPSLKVIGVGYFRKKNCYWRYFYVKDLWESFRCAVEYFILISTLPSEVHIDHKLLCFVASRNGVQKKFSFHPSVLNAYTHMVAFVNGNEYGRPSRSRSYSSERRFYIKNPCGVDHFDPEKVGTQKCTVADVLEVSIKRKLISLPDASAPRRHYTQKAATATPTIKLKLDPQLIYQGIFVSTPTSSSNSTTATSISNQNQSPRAPGSGTNSRVDLTPNNSFYSSCNAILPNPATPRGTSSYNYTQYNSVNSSGGLDSDTTIEGPHSNGNNINSNTISKACSEVKEGMTVDNLFDLKLNNLNIILSYYPDVCTQYNTIIKQANDLKTQLALLLSDLKCIVFDPLQNGVELFPNNFNSQNGEAGGPKHESTDNANGNAEVKEVADLLKKKAEAAGAKKYKLPMSDVCYNSATSSWVCFLEVMPCLVCPLECDRTGSCVYYTQGKRLIELICSKMKPSSVQYAFHPHFSPDSHQNHQDKKQEVGVVSFSVNQFGQERAKLLASQLKATYKTQALNTMLHSVSKDKNGNSGDTKKSNESGGELPNSFEMKILHNVITAHLTTLMSIHSYIVYDDEEYDALESKNFRRIDIEKILKGHLGKNRGSSDSTKKAFSKGYRLKTSEQLNDLIKDKVNELNSCNMSEAGGFNYSDIIDTIHANGPLNWLKNGVFNQNHGEMDGRRGNVANNSKDDDANVSNSTSKAALINVNDKEVINRLDVNTDSGIGYYESLLDAPDDSVDLNDDCDASSSSTEDSYRECFCYYYGNHIRGSEGDLEVCNVVRFNENLYTFSNIFEMSRLIQLNSRKLHYCPRHCCFVTVWKDAIDQTRIMFHPIERFIPFKSFDAYVSKFKRDWPEAVRIHNLHSRSRDSAEGSKMVAKVNAILCECFGNLLSLQKIINDAVVTSMTLAIRALCDASQEKSLLSRLFLINEHFRVSKDAMRNAMVFSNEILFPFGALHDEATPPISDDDF
ncbi:conserved hypothetical protein [Theileria orientalis strain Shintoku]|uniref:Uncharacterized protein n=1 Tax=Theileria orientalis strain Shintoku TaxID=869250 RepID=J4CDW4_THEOR|nr:conserved hypothetical protein [Theileria orientalis strain Shintoku]BAM41847.1 conserved hypothetical protein [Theileria orientalis strain Shintoku]|eukprot:XP_009692148.1 conserved hypothetical protein [Theileria orientalis strain Shintoku]